MSNPVLLGLLWAGMLQQFHPDMLQRQFCNSMPEK
jgi:hypothetical protein